MGGSGDGWGEGHLYSLKTLLLGLNIFNLICIISVTNMNYVILCKGD